MATGSAEILALAKRHHFPVTVVAATILYFVAVMLGHRVGHIADGLGGLWIANALVLVLFLKCSPREWLALAAGIFIAGLASRLFWVESADVSAGLALANVIQIAGSAGLIVAVDRGRVWSGDVYTSLRAVAIAAAAPAILSPVGAALLTAANGGDFVSLLWSWWSGSAVGVLLVMPVALSATAARWREAVSRAGLKWLLPLSLSIAAVAFFATVLTDRPFVVASLPLAAAAMVLNPLATTIASTVSVLAMIVAEALGFDGGAGDVPRSTVRLYATLTMLMPFAVSLLVGRLRDERARIAESEKRFRLAMDCSAIGVAIVGLDGGWVRVNPAVCDLFGYSEGELKRLTFADLTHPDDIDADMALVKRTLAGEIGSYRMEKRYIRKDGSIVWALLAVALMRDEESDEPLYFISQIEDITARKHAEKALAESESRWHSALDSGGQGVWDYNLLTRKAFYSPTWKAILGYRDEELIDSPDLWRGLTHPQDIAKVETAAMDLVEGRSDNLRVEFRMRHKDGHWVWVVDRGKIIERDAAGKPIRMIGTHADVTVRMDAERDLKTLAERLRTEEQRLRVTLDSIGDGVIATDVLGRVTFMNPSAEAETGWNESEAIGQDIGKVFRVFREADNVALPNPVSACVAAGGRVLSSDAVLFGRKGRKRLVRTSAALVKIDGENVSGVVVVFQDMTRARRLQQRLAHSAAHDALTGLRNRASFEEELVAACQEATDSGRVHAICLIDLDQFKAVNDSGGHAAGDAVLREVARVARNSVRGEDIIARLGGDEFALLLRDCPLAKAETLARRIVAGINALKVRHDGMSFAVGASAGVAPVTPSFGSDAVMKEADAACYAAKAAGRRTVRVAGCDEEKAPATRVAAG